MKSPRHINRCRGYQLILTFRRPLAAWRRPTSGYRSGGGKQGRDNERLSFTLASAPTATSHGPTLKFGANTFPPDAPPGPRSVAGQKISRRKKRGRVRCRGSEYNAESLVSDFQFPDSEFPISNLEPRARPDKCRSNFFQPDSRAAHGSRRLVAPVAVANGLKFERHEEEDLLSPCLPGRGQAA